MIKRTIIIAMAVAALTASAQTAVKITATKANDYGLSYTLPKTVIDVVVEAELTELQPGEFSAYAKRYLNINDAIMQPAKMATIKSVNIYTHGEGDPERRYIMQIKGNVPTFVMLDQTGAPIAINDEDAQQPGAPTLPVAVAAQPTALEVPAAAQAITQDMMMSTSLSKKAQFAANRIFELRENRNDLISGQAENVPPDGASMQLALDNLSAQENALIAMFAGTQKTWTEVTTLSYQPEADDVKNIVIGRLSPTDGFVAVDDLTGAPIYLSLAVTETPKMPVDDKGKEVPFPKNGVAYTIPGTANVSVAYDGRTIATKQVELAQLGFTYGLDPKLLADKKTRTVVNFDPATGAVLSIISE